MFKRSNRYELTFSQDSRYQDLSDSEKNYVKVVSVHDSFLIVDNYFNRKLTSRLTLPYSELKIRELQDKRD
jgi:hypothetical protein